MLSTAHAIELARYQKRQYSDPRLGVRKQKAFSFRGDFVSGSPDQGLCL